MSDTGPADSEACKCARLIRQLRRQVALGVLLALLIVLDWYVPLGGHQSWVQYAELWVAGALAVDVLVRPIVVKIWPDFVIIGYGPRGK
jgi:hypothetical protein